jgi:secretion/DNA translocation related CpaE-like protein
VVTDDEELLDDLLRLAAAAGIEVEVARDPTSARSRWPIVPLVVVGDDQADGLANLAPTRRSDVLLVSRNMEGDDAWRQGVALGAEHVLFLPADESWLAGKLADAMEGENGDARVVGVIGGRGGAGASVMAAALSVTAARRGLSVVLVDLDPLGGGLDLILGAEGDGGLRWPDFADSKGRLAARAVHAQLPCRHGVPVLSWDRGDLLTIGPEATNAVLGATRRASELVVLDLPRWPDVIAEDAMSLCSSVLLVVPTEVRAVAAASRLVVGLTAHACDLRLVTRGLSSASLSGRDVASVLQLPLSVHIEPEPRLNDQLDRGNTPGLDSKGPLVTACHRLLDDFQLRRQGRAA